MKPSTLIFWGLTFALVAGVLAAEPVPTIQFRTLAWGESLNELQILSKDKYVPITAENYARSPFYEANLVDGGFSLYRMEKNEKGEMIPKRVATIKTDGVKPPLLVLLHVEEDGSIGFGVSTDDVAAFPPGSYRFVNFSSYPLLLNIGTGTFEVVPNATELVKVGPLAEEGRVSVEIYTKADPLLRVYSSVWGVDPRARVLIYAMNSGKATKPVTFKQITENAMFSETPAVAPKSQAAPAKP